MNKPIYHITPEKGWMNDPNGLVEYNGVYHVFYQADPEHLINENIGWGHKISSDLLHWEECQPALLPDQSYDRDGCFTGSAVIKDVSVIYRSCESGKRIYRNTESCSE